MMRTRKAPPNNEIGRRIWLLRQVENLSQKAFAAKYGFTSTLISYAERNTKAISPEKIGQLVDVFGTEIFGEFLTPKPCGWCGKMFMPKTDKNMFCDNPDCKRQSRLAHMRDSHRLHTLNKKRKPLAKALFEVNQQAREHGLSYGYYVGVILPRPKGGTFNGVDPDVFQAVDFTDNSLRDS